jgi:hypothetical protein
LVIGRFRSFAKGGFVGEPHQHDLFAVDDKGFVNSRARCDGTQTAVAIGPKHVDAGFIAKNASVTYSISPDELRVRSAAR